MKKLISFSIFFLIFQSCSNEAGNKTKIKNEFDYILVAKKNLLNENFKILSSQLEQTLNKIKAL